MCVCVCVCVCVCARARARVLSQSAQHFCRAYWTEVLIVICIILDVSCSAIVYRHFIVMIMIVSIFITSILVSYH